MSSSQNNFVRHCFKCGREIRECMGFVHAGDFVAAMEGKLDPKKIKERCWRCADTESSNYTEELKEFGVSAA